jgi:Tetratricopeptide repeat
VYPNAKVTKFIVENLIPVRLHVKSHAADMERFAVQWTPTVLLVDPAGHERHRIEGFLPTDDFLTQLHIGLAHAAFRANRFDESERLYRAVVDQFPDSDAAAEAQYWAGVSKYKGSNDATALAQTAQAFQKKYSDSSWAKKASIWA